MKRKAILLPEIITFLVISLWSSYFVVNRINLFWATNWHFARPQNKPKINWRVLAYANQKHNTHQIVLRDELVKMKPKNALKVTRKKEINSSWRTRKFCLVASLWMHCAHCISHPSISRTSARHSNNHSEKNTARDRPSRTKYTLKSIFLCFLHIFKLLHKRKSRGETKKTHRINKQLVNTQRAPKPRWHRERENEALKTKRRNFFLFKNSKWDTSTRTTRKHPGLNAH